MKLYWRIKKDGKWTWKPASICDTESKTVIVWKEEEE